MENNKDKEILQDNSIITPGEEFSSQEQPPIERKDTISQEYITQLKEKSPYNKFAFFYHVEDLYLYKSYTTAELEELNSKRKVMETESGKTLTDEEYLCLFLDKFVIKPEGCGQMNKEKKLSAGVPHLLYDLINHLSGFAEVEPVIL